MRSPVGEYVWEIAFLPEALPDDAWFLWIAKSALPGRLYTGPEFAGQFPSQAAAAEFRDKYFQYLRDLRDYEEATNFRGSVTI